MHHVKPESFLRRAGVRWTAAPLICVLFAMGVYIAACASSSSPSSTASPTTSVVADMSTSPPSPDPRVGLRPATVKRWEKDTTRRVIDQPAGEAIWNLRLVSNTPPSDRFVGVTNSDLAFTGKYAIQGNYNGFQVWDISNRSEERR